MTVGNLWSESVSWGLQEELMRQRGRRHGLSFDHCHHCCDYLTAVVLGLLLDLLVSCQARLNSPLPPCTRRARFRCAPLCSKFLITTDRNGSSHRINSRLIKQPQARQLLVPANQRVLRDSLRVEIDFQLRTLWRLSLEKQLLGQHWVKKLQMPHRSRQKANTHWWKKILSGSLPQPNPRIS